MKTDRVLTMSECLANWYIGAIGVKPPADDARHIPITAEDDLNGKQGHGCRCDRWGHPCPGCLDKSDVQPRTERQDFSSAKK
jgi:hypothetical protein